LDPDDDNEHDVDVGVDDDDKTVVGGTDIGGNECIKLILNKLKFKRKSKLSEKSSLFISFLFLS
jgi:hypothetical protein